MLPTFLYNIEELNNFSNIKCKHDAMKNARLLYAYMSYFLPTEKPTVSWTLVS